MNSPFVPLEIGLIDQGKFVGRINDALRENQVALIEHMKEHGGKAKGGKATLTMKVHLKCEDPESMATSIKAELSKTLPAPPANITMAMVGEDEKGDCLFVRKTGSSKDSPMQAVLCTEDGQTVDPATGEILEEAPA